MENNSHFYIGKVSGRNTAPLSLTALFLPTPSPFSYAAGLDYYGYFYVNGRYFHASNLSNWSTVSKPVRGSTAKHKGKAMPIFSFVEGKCEVRRSTRKQLSRACRVGTTVSCVKIQSFSML